MHWSYCSLALSHCYLHYHTPSKLFCRDPGPGFLSESVLLWWVLCRRLEGKWHVYIATYWMTPHNRTQLMNQYEWVLWEIIPHDKTQLMNQYEWVPWEIITHNRTQLMNQYEWVPWEILPYNGTQLMNHHVCVTWEIIPHNGTQLMNSHECVSWNVTHRSSM